MPLRIAIHEGREPRDPRLLDREDLDLPAVALHDLADLRDATQLPGHVIVDGYVIVRYAPDLPAAEPGARKPIEVALHLDGGRLEGILCDGGVGARAISRRDSSSLVVRIVNGLVEEWGATDNGEKRIWFRMNVQPV